MLRCIIFITLIFSVLSASNATVVVYNAPSTIPASTKYSVSLQQKGKKYSPFCYLNKSTLAAKPHLASSFVNFDMSGKVAVKIKVADSIKLTDVVVRPLSKNITAKIKGQYIYFDINEPMQLSVEINQSIDHTLLIFANPLEENVPLKNDSNVVWFGPGIHNVGAFVMPEGKNHIYIHGSAYLKGNLEFSSDVTVTGRGIVSGEDYIYKTNVYRSLVKAKRVEGIVLLNTPYYNLHCTIGKWVKCISWYGQTDGVHINENGIIENCFFKVNDDVFKLYNSGIRVSNCVAWLQYTGAPFQLTWNLMGHTRSDIHVSNIDIIHTQYETEHINRAIINSVHGGDANVSGVVFDSIRVEGDTWRLMMLTLKRTRYGNAEKLGDISNIVVRNLTVTGKVLTPSKLTGVVEKDGRISSIKGIVFENLVVDGKQVIDVNGAKGWVVDTKTAEYPIFK